MTPTLEIKVPTNVAAEDAGIPQVDRLSSLINEGYRRCSSDSLCI
ncbi:MAG: hypothetical protein ACI9R3_001050 [Verrucomicrobiales bacterium]|jgi:hypothetical protein